MDAFKGIPCKSSQDVAPSWKAPRLYPSQMAISRYSQVVQFLWGDPTQIVEQLEEWRYDEWLREGRRTVLETIRRCPWEEFISPGRDGETSLYWRNEKIPRASTKKGFVSSSFVIIALMGLVTDGISWLMVRKFLHSSQKLIFSIYNKRVLGNIMEWHGDCVIFFPRRDIWRFARKGRTLFSRNNLLVHWQ